MESERTNKDRTVPSGGPSAAWGPYKLKVTLDLGAGAFVLEWIDLGKNRVLTRARILPSSFAIGRHFTLHVAFDNPGIEGQDSCGSHASSVRAMVQRLRKRAPVDSVEFGLLSNQELGRAQPGRWLPVPPPNGMDPWKWLTYQVGELASLLTSKLNLGESPEERGKTALYFLACSLLHVKPPREFIDKIQPAPSLLDLRVIFQLDLGFTHLIWTAPQSDAIVAQGKVRAPASYQLTWDLEVDGQHETRMSMSDRNAIRSCLGDWIKRFPTNQKTFSACRVSEDPLTGKVRESEAPRSVYAGSIFQFIEDNLVGMASAASEDMADIEEFGEDLAKGKRRLLKRMQAEEEKRRRLTAALLEQQRRRQEQRAKRDSVRSKPAEKSSARETTSARPPAPATPLPPLPVHIHLPPLALPETSSPLRDLRGYLLRERAALWWVSNQSDDLLCLPNCRIQRLDYQLRTALRVLGPLRGRALLSDEVGLGKTIEAGLVIKELLTRGMVKRFLVLTVPSLVDQWEEELNDKFGLETSTTNQPTIKSDPQRFWRESTGIVASLHTLKQPAHLEIARQVPWDILIVDEAHYLRNRESQAWQAVNALPRQFLLLLTATPVQNSLEELYNLVTLLQPGQLPTPKEFRSRFMDPQKPRQPREPEELRRLLSQIMIRNTRANSGLQLPPRRAETVLFTPEQNERAFWQQWETELRAKLASLNASQSSLWGRLLLQAAGSSPQAWRAALKNFPDKQASTAWRETAVADASWRKKCELVLPLTRGEGGVVIFTQFLETQAALAQFLGESKVNAFVINGSTPAPERQPITEQFRREGGALLLTHSGTEGRNLQFSHRLVNFDLPWNPMEIEQRIGRLHRLGQQHPVRIFNFVQAETLQEHLLDILQEKLNLFELVVGEAGLILGDRFGSDEFAEEILHRWRESDGRVAEAFATLGQELAEARDTYKEVKQLDETLFSKDYESL